jgi:capsular polysaccharide biosynthesis protein
MSDRRGRCAGNAVRANSAWGEGLASMPTTEGVRPSPTPESLATMLRRRWLLIVVAAVIGLVLGLVITELQTPTYRATATVLVTPTGVQNSADLANGRTNSEINLDTEARLLRSTDVADRVREMLGTTTSSFDLAKKTEVTVPPNTEVLSIAFIANSPTAAQQGAHAFALAYLQQRAGTGQAALDEQVRKVQREVEGLNTTLRAVSGKLVKLPNASPERAYTAAQRSLITSQISALNQLLGRLTTTVVTPGRLLTDAQLPTQPNSPFRLLNLASGLAVGLLVGLVVAWMWARRDHRVYQPAQVQRTLGIPVVTTVPAVRLDAVEPVRTPAGEAYRRLANTLPAVLEDSTGVILVAAATPGVAGDVVGANLATALARTGAGVHLLQVDRASHFCANLLNADEPAAALSVGMKSSHGGVAVPGYVRQVVPGLPALAVVSSMPSSADDPPMAEDSGCGIVEHLRLRGDYLVVVAPSTASGADAQALASRSDAVILAIELGTSQEQALDALAQFDDVRAPVLGAVVLPQPRRGEPAAPSAPTEVVSDLPDVAPGDGLATSLARKPERVGGEWARLPMAAGRGVATGRAASVGAAYGGAPTAVPADRSRPGPVSAAGGPMPDDESNAP